MRAGISRRAGRGLLEKGLRVAIKAVAPRREGAPGERQRVEKEDAASFGEKVGQRQAKAGDRQIEIPVGDGAEIGERDEVDEGEKSREHPAKAERRRGPL